MAKKAPAKKSVPKKVAKGAAGSVKGGAVKKIDKW
jgi:hypothetical protein